VKLAARIAFLSLLSCLAFASAEAGVIRGVVRLATPAGKASVNSKLQERARRAERAAVQEAVVYLDAIPEKVEKKIAGKDTVARMAQAFGRFIPGTLAVPAGTTVEFENQDRVYHNAFSVSATKKFDVGKYPPRGSRQVKFDRPGEVKLFCDIDPEETGFVFVTPNRAFVQPDSAGAFQFPKLPPGKYKVRVWHPSRSRTSREVEMPKKGDVVLELKI
jgi:plastocyanin